MTINANNLLAVRDPWHDGTGTITYSFLNSVPNYYPAINSDGTGGNDSRAILMTREATPRPDEIVDPAANVSLTPAQQVLADRAVAAWNEVANTNIVPRAAGGGVTGTPITGDGTLMGGLGGTTQLLARGDDGPNPSVDIASVFANGLNFFGTTYRSLFVNINGSVSFGSAVGTFTPTTITAGGTPLITPFWADVDTRLDTSQPIAPPPAQVSYNLDAGRGIFTATWAGVDYFNVSATNHQPKQNFFQLQLYDRGGGDATTGNDFDIVFRYQQIGWTAGDLSGGTNGLGGPNTARGGWTAGNGTNFEEIRASGIESAMLNLHRTPGNTASGANGLFVFNVRNGQITVGDLTFGRYDAFSTNGTDGAGIAGPPPGVAGAPVLANYAGAVAVTDIGSFTSLGAAGGVLGTPSPHGDIWFNRPQAAVYGDEGWSAYLHEVGRAIGLTLPTIGGVEDPNNTTPGGNANNNNQHTVMSYVPHPNAGPGSWPITPMVLDIEAIQALYGPNLTTRTGATVYFGPGANAYPMLNGGLMTNGRHMVMTIWDAGGTDTINAANQTADVDIDLNPGAYSSIGHINNIGIAKLVAGNPNYIENATGGSANDLIIGNVIDNELKGGPGHDNVDGLEGHDRVFGDGGNDLLAGGDGNDLIRGGLDNDNITGGAGLDRLDGDEGGDTLAGGDSNDTILGGAGADRLDGDAGDDVLDGGTENDTMFGGLGADDLVGGVGNDSMSGGAGADELDGGTGNDDMSGEGEVDRLTGGDGTDTMDGGEGADSLFGGRDNDTMAGGGGNDFIDGSLGADRMSGDLGDDRFFVDNLADTTADLLNGGLDSVISTVDHTLGPHVDNLTLIGTALRGTGNDIANRIIGNALDNTLRGLAGDDRLEGAAGADVLDGGVGADLMVGGLGDDDMFVDNVGDVTAEVAGQGIDWVFSSVNHTLRANIENLVLTGIAIIGVGNTLDNFILGNNVNNNLDGGLGDDTIRGQGGNDIITGGAGEDTMLGELDNDAYGVDNAGDIVTEAANQGIDGVFSSINYTLTANVENLQLVGAALVGTGNNLNNAIVGTAGNNTLNGLGGADNLNGLGGNDFYFVDSAGDAVNEAVGAGNDRVFTSVSYTLLAGQEIETLSTTGGAAPINLTGNAFANIIIGNAGANTITGGGGTDNLNGLGGSDRYIVDSLGDVVNEAANGGNDRVTTSVSYALLPTAEVETLVTSNNASTAAINLTGSNTANLIVGNAGVNTLDGRGGADSLMGLGGNDFYFVDSAADLVSEAESAGNDRVFASVSYTLGAGSIETLSTNNNAATTAINLTGNHLANTIQGNAGTNILSGGAGIDLMLGFGGADRYIVDHASDSLREAAGGGSDRVLTSVAYTLTAGQEIETLSTVDPTAALGINLTGNEFNNAIVGDAGNSTLDGGVGNDTLYGLAGNDAYLVDSAGDVVLETTGAGVDRVFASASFALRAGSEVETLATNDDDGTAAINLTGNEFEDDLRGNAGRNILDGRTGADGMTGLAGDDDYFVDSALDEPHEQINGGFDRVFTTVSYHIFASFSIEALAITDSATTTDLSLTGNEFANALTGNAGDNRLDGNLGADTLTGLAGDDQYYVDNAGDLVIEGVGGGNDRIFVESLFLVGSTYALAAGSAVETLSTTNPGALSSMTLIGNSFVNTIVGNAGANTLDGRGGADALFGNAGNDFYFVDNAADRTIETAGGGADRVLTSVSFVLTTGSEIELLKTTNDVGTEAIDLGGNAFANQIYGNDGANQLDGRGGNDIMVGNGGNDLYFIDSAGDRAVEAAGDGMDRVLTGVSYALEAGSEIELFTTLGGASTNAINLTGNAFANQIFGNAGVNIIAGGLGNDTMNGLAGADGFLFNTALNASSNVDRLADFSVADDTVRLDNAIFTALSEGTLAAGAFRIGAAALDADDRIIYNAATGALSYDANGVAAGPAILFATLATGLAMTNADFFVL